VASSCAARRRASLDAQEHIRDVFDGLTLFVSHAVDRINSIPATSAYSLGRRLTEGLMGNRYGRRAQSLALTYSTFGSREGTRESR
jgi:hypothetical protein